MENRQVGTGSGDLIVYYCGSSSCEPGLAWGPGIRDHYIIHLVLEGRGRVTTEGKTFHAGKGEGFLLRPEEVAYYQSDAEMPWTYAWVGFYGDRAHTLLENAGLTDNVIVFKYESDNMPEKILLQMNEENVSMQARDSRLTGLLYLFFSSMIDRLKREAPLTGSDDSRSVYTGKSIDYIKRNYSRKISVTELARYLGIDRRYFHRFFKGKTGKSPQEYIISYRMERACGLMVNRELSIADISRSVGYEDQFLFSRIFSKYMGTSPQNYRRALNGIK